MNTRYKTPRGIPVSTRELWYFWRSKYRLSARIQARKLHRFAFSMLCDIWDGRKVGGES